MTGLTDELHVIQHREIISILEVRPNTFLRFRNAMKGGRVGTGDSASSDRGDKAGAEENAEDA